MLMLDLCCGLGGASEAMRAHGWEVVTVDIEASFAPTICMDVRQFLWDGPRPDLVWASPPCTEFARESMPWCKTGQHPDMAIFNACLSLVQSIQPRYWAIENVKGSIPYFSPYLGQPQCSNNPYFVWTNAGVGKIRFSKRHKESFSSKRRAERSKVPYEISDAFRFVCESQLSLNLS